MQKALHDRYHFKGSMAYEKPVEGTQVITGVHIYIPTDGAPDQGGMFMPFGKSQHYPKSCIVINCKLLDMF